MNQKILTIFFLFFLTMAFIFFSCGNIENNTKDYTPPSEVTNLNITAADSNAILTWTMPIDADLAGVEISSEPADGTLESPLILGKKASSLRISGLTIGSEYTFKIRTFDESLNYSKGISVTSTVQDTKDYTPPSEVTNLNITAADSNAILTWTMPIDADLAGVEISSEPADGTLTSPVILCKDTTSFTVSELAIGSEYLFKIRTFDDCLNFSDGISINFTPEEVYYYVVIFDIGEKDFYKTEIVKMNTEISEPEIPLKTGYIFKGWYTDSKYKTPFDFNYIITTNVHLYAKYIENVKYSVTFNTNGGTEIETQSVLNGLTAMEPAVEPKKDDYIFKGWYADTQFEIPFDFDSPITNNVELYAKWNKVHTVNFETNVGSEIESQKIEDGFSALMPQNNPTKYKYVFMGWYTTNELSTEFNFESKITADTTVYAKWEDVLVVEGSKGLDYETSEETVYEVVGDYYQEVTKKVCSITGIGECIDTVVYIPKSIDGYTVTKIEKKAFDNCTAITQFVISLTVTTIEDRAFQYCTGITEFTVPENVTSIGDQIFYGCSSLTTIYCNSNAGNLSMWQNPSVRKVVFGDNLTTVPDNFRNCSHIEEIRLSKNTQSLEVRNMFEGCTNLTNIELPEGLSYLDWNLFDNAGLKSLKFPSSLTSIDGFTRTLPYLEYIILPVSIRSVLGLTLDCTYGYKTFYSGTQNDWDYISISEEASSIKADVYFYSESQPTENGKWWHYNSEGEPIIWE